MTRGRKPHQNVASKLAPESISMLHEIADQSQTDFVHVDDDKRYILAALAREKYVERHGQDAKLTNKGRKQIGLDPVDTDITPDTDRVIMDALAKARSAAPKPVVSKLPQGFVESRRQPRPPVATTPQAEQVAHSEDTHQVFHTVIAEVRARDMQIAESPAPAPLPEAAALAADCHTGGVICDPNCLSRRALELIFNRYPHMRQVIDGIQTIDAALEK